MEATVAERGPPRCDEAIVPGLRLGRRIGGHGLPMVAVALSPHVRRSSSSS